MPTIGENISTMSQIVDYAVKEPRLDRPLDPHYLLHPRPDSSEQKKAAGINYSAYSTLQSAMDIPKSVSSAITEYAENQKTFRDELKEAMENARKTSSALKEINYQNEQAAAAAADKLVEQDPVREYPQKTQEIQSLITDYNSTISYLNDQRGLSPMFDSFADTFGDTGQFMQSLDDIGISTDITGELTVHAEALDKALQERPRDVEDTLSQNGLAGRIDRNVELSDKRGSDLFPSVDSLLGRPDDTRKGMYSEKSVVHTRPSDSYGKFMDMYY